MLMLNAGRSITEEGAGPEAIHDRDVRMRMSQARSVHVHLHLYVCMHVICTRAQALLSCDLLNCY